MRADLAEIAAMKKEVARLRVERDILKKAAAFSRARRHEVRPYRQTRHIWPVSWLCDVLDVSRSGFHAASRPATGPMVPAACGVIFWKKGFPAGCTGSNG